MRRRWSAVAAAAASVALSGVQFGVGFARAVVAHEAQVIDLAELDWTLTNGNGSISIPASFPSQVHLDLVTAGVIRDPYIGSGELDTRWIISSNWTYATDIPTIPSSSTAWVIFDGLDTFTTIRVCGSELAKTDNMFLQYKFRLDDVMFACRGRETNHLSIEFGPAVEIAAQLAARPGQKQWKDGIQGVFEFPNREQVRKQQNDFGWDWGPAFVPAGPWMGGRLVFLGPSQIHVDTTHINVHRRGQQSFEAANPSEPWEIDVNLGYIGNLPPNSTAIARLRDPQSRLVKEGPLVNLEFTQGRISGQLNVSTGFADLWWPNGMGGQPLYDLSIEVVELPKHHLAMVERTIGFRSVVLRFQNVTETEVAAGAAPGSHWHFEVNGKRMYVKGSNMVPLDAFWPRVHPSRMEWLLNSARDGNQNMIRVWSSGAYLPEYAYEIADRLGIMIWSDFQFSDAIYPSDKGFVANVVDEASYQVRRLAHHPSIAIWAGGNELENLELGLVEEISPGDLADAVAAYEDVFINALSPVVFSNARGVSYIPSSSSKGLLSVQVNGSMSVTPRYKGGASGELHGSTEYYNYDARSAFDSSLYPVGRFAVEFGFHSLPSARSFEQVLPRSRLKLINSTDIVIRTKHYPASQKGGASRGIDEMIAAVTTWFPTPAKSGDYDSFSTWCLATQMFQADFLRSQIQHYRRGMSGPERQSGALFWQLNDIWQGTSWSSIEYDGSWKPAQYATQSEFKPVTSSFLFSAQNETVDVVVSSTSPKVEVVALSIGCMDWTGRPIQLSVEGTKAHPIFHSPDAQLFDVRSEVFIQPLSSETVVSFPISGRSLLPTSRDAWVCQATTSLRPTLQNPGDEIIAALAEEDVHTAWFHPTSLAEARLVDPGLVVSYAKSAAEARDPDRPFYSGHFIVEARNGVAAWVWLEYVRARKVKGAASGPASSSPTQSGEDASERFLVKVSDDEEGARRIEVVASWGGQESQEELYHDSDSEQSDGPLDEQHEHVRSGEPTTIQTRAELDRFQKRQTEELLAQQEKQVEELDRQHRELLNLLQTRQERQFGSVAPFLSKSVRDQFRRSLEEQLTMFEQEEDLQLLQLQQIHEQQLLQLKQMHRQQQDAFSGSGSRRTVIHQRDGGKSAEAKQKRSSLQTDPRIADLLTQKQSEQARLAATQADQVNQLIQLHATALADLRRSHDTTLAEAKSRTTPEQVEILRQQQKQQFLQFSQFQREQERQLTLLHQNQQFEIERKFRNQIESIRDSAGLGPAVASKVATSNKARVRRQIFATPDTAVSVLSSKQKQQRNELIELQMIQVTQLAAQHQRLLAQLAQRQQAQFASLRRILPASALEDFRQQAGRQLKKFQLMESAQLDELKGLHRQQLVQLDGLQQRQILQLQADLATPVAVTLQDRLSRLQVLQQRQTGELVDLHAKQIEQLQAQHQRLLAQVVDRQLEQLSKIGPAVPVEIIEQIKLQQKQQFAQFQAQQQQQLSQLSQLHGQQLTELQAIQKNQLEQLRQAGRVRSVIDLPPIEYPPEVVDELIEAGHERDWDDESYDLDDDLESGSSPRRPPPVDPRSSPFSSKDHPDHDDGDSAFPSLPPLSSLPPLQMPNSKPSLSPSSSPTPVFPTRVHFVQNAFWLRPGEKRRVDFIAFRAESTHRDKDLPLSTSAFISAADYIDREMADSEITRLSTAGWLKRVKVTSVWDWNHERIS